MAFNYTQNYYNAAGPLPGPDIQQPLMSYNINSNGAHFHNAVSPPSSALIAAQDKASRKRVVAKTSLIAAGIFVCTIGMIFAFISYLCVFHQCQASKSAVVSTAPLGPVLTISQVTSHVAPLSVPIVMGILSNLASARWLKSSIDGGPDRPSPMQLGLLMTMYDGAGLSSLFSSIKYIFIQPKGGRKIGQPPILRQCIILLAMLLAITYITAAADSWLHASSTSVILTSKLPYSSNVVPIFGREINATMCAQAQGVSDVPSASCGLDPGGSAGNGPQLAEGVRVASNTSSLHRVVLTDDQIAIVVPPSLPGNISYSAETLGVKSICRSITRECMPPPEDDNGIPIYGPNAALILNCTQGGFVYAAGTGISPLCALDSQVGNCTVGEFIDTNPFNAGEIVISTAYLEAEAMQQDQFINNTGWFVHGNKGAWDVVYCNISALSVTYRYESSQYITESTAIQPLTIARYIMSGGFDNVGTTIISTAVAGAGIQGNTTFEEAYAMELSRQMLARSAHIYEPRAVLQIQSENSVNGSKLRFIPLVLFVGALVVFLCQVLYISIRTIVATWGVQYVGLAARHLSSPLTAMQRLYGHPSPEFSWEMDSEKGFGPETEYDRLRIGPVALASGGLPSAMFAVGKG